MSLMNNNSCPLTVKLIGPIDHQDFREAAALIRDSARSAIAAGISPELVVICQARPGQISQHEVESLQRRWPLAGIVTIAGSWCEGEIRTGRPWPGVKRFYWYEFPAWWRLQLAQRSAGLCPDWSRPTSDALRRLAIHNRRCGIIVLSAANRHIADALAEVLRYAGYATVWHPPGRPTTIVRGAIAGIWDGGQLNDREAEDLAAFCHTLARDAASVVALLDFPRRDRYEVAQQLGAAAVLGKPWINTDLIATIEALANRDAEVPPTPTQRRRCMRRGPSRHRHSAAVAARCRTSRSMCWSPRPAC